MIATTNLALRFVPGLAGLAAQGHAGFRALDGPTLVTRDPTTGPELAR